MEESRRQKKVGRLIHEELSDIFKREGLDIINGGMVSLCKVQVTPDLLEVRVYLSFFQVTDHEGLLIEIKERSHDIKRKLSFRLKHQLRRIPDIQYYLDNSIEDAYRMEELFTKLQKGNKDTSSDHFS